MFRPPCEDMKGQLVLLAPRLELRARSSIDMDLPRHHLERLVIVDIVDNDPGQPITPVNVAGFSLAQGRMTIIDGDLRYCPEQELTEEVEFRQRWEYHRHHACADDVGDLSLGCRKGEHPVRGLNQALCEGDALKFVAIQQRVGRAA